MNYIKGFNALRAVSVILVVLTHLDLSDWIPNTEFVMNRVWPMMSGDFGVQIFFVLSGFLITNILIHEKVKKGKINFKNFFARRFLRLLPPFILFFILVTIATSFGYLTNAKESILYALFYAYNFVPRNLYSYEMAHFWSLGVEEQFYILWPFSLVIFSSAKKIILFLFVLIIICCSFSLVAKSLVLFQDYFLTRWFIPASCPILTGCLAAVINFYYENKTVEFLKNKLLTTFIILLSYSYTLYAPQQLIPLNIFIQSIAIALFLLVILHSQNKKWVQLLEFRPLTYIGIISYGIYVYQGFFLRTGGGSEVWFQTFPTNILLSVLIAVLCYELIEKPILKLKKHFN